MPGESEHMPRQLKGGVSNIEVGIIVVTCEKDRVCIKSLGCPSLPVALNLNEDIDSCRKTLREVEELHVDVQLALKE